MDQMWPSFTQTIQKLYGKDKIEQLNMNQSMQLEKLLGKKLEEIIEIEQSGALVISQGK